MYPGSGRSPSGSHSPGSLKYRRPSGPNARSFGIRSVSESTSVAKTSTLPSAIDTRWMQPGCIRSARHAPTRPLFWVTYR